MQAAVFLRPLGTPFPLGLVGLLVASAVLSCFNLGWIPLDEQRQVGIVLLAFAFPLQGIATVLLFLARDAPSGAGIGVLAATWLSYGSLLVLTRPGTTDATAAVLLFASAAALAPAAITSLLSETIPGLVMTLAAVRFVLTGLHEKLPAGGWERAAGWEGLVVAALALYTALACDLESSAGHDRLPLGRHGRGAHTMAQTVADQGVKLQREPGVRSRV